MYDVVVEGGESILNFRFINELLSRPGWLISETYANAKMKCKLNIFFLPDRFSPAHLLFYIHTFRVTFSQKKQKQAKRSFKIFLFEGYRSTSHSRAHDKHLQKRIYTYLAMCLRTRRQQQQEHTREYTKMAQKV